MRNRYSLLLLVRCALASPLLTGLKKPAHSNHRQKDTHPPRDVVVRVLGADPRQRGPGSARWCLCWLNSWANGPRYDELHLRVLATSSTDENEQKNAKKVLDLMQKGRHWVLVVLLLGNVIVNESLPIFLDSAIGGGFAAVALSTTAIVIFGYRLPQIITNTTLTSNFLTLLGKTATCRRNPGLLGAVFAFMLRTLGPWRSPSLPPSRIIPQAMAVRYGLSIGATCAPFVLVLMYILAPIAYPIARLLDAVLGANETHTYKKAELKSFLQFHRTGEEPLRDDEISILNGVLELNTKHVEEIMTPMRVRHCSRSLFIYPHSHLRPPGCRHALLLRHPRRQARRNHAPLLSGYSRFPVHEPHDPDAFVGLLLIKKLIKYDPAQALPVSSMPLSILPEAPPSINCFQALDYFQTGRAHLLLISNTPASLVVRSVSLPLRVHIIEEILSEEIVDETDRYEDNVTKQKARRITTAAVMRGIVERVANSGASTGERTPMLTARSLSRSVSRSVDRGADGERTPLVSALSSSVTERNNAMAAAAAARGGGWERWEGAGRVRGRRSRGREDSAWIHDYLAQRWERTAAMNAHATACLEWQNSNPWVAAKPSSLFGDSSNQVDFRDTASRTEALLRVMLRLSWYRTAILPNDA
ncbi:CAMK CAMKL CHK1 protein kinase [Mycena sanguinolenta]|uniref:CAMK CAMKL CHK1 protein kinase n=1 Tax=Mycena sanguinolenta TaxID=230812 RepID=A0A8H6YI59_9AGAR|nr:CAMK CAMKL CHK1 protein kinase [Mycena sanguinolenta]